MRSKSAQLLSLEDTALVLGIGRSTIYRAVRDGKVPFPGPPHRRNVVRAEAGARAVPRRRGDS